MKEVKIISPPTDCLSPIGEEDVKTGLKKEINAELFPGEDVDLVYAVSSIPPEGKHYVTCYACHRGSRIPLTEPPAQARR